MEHMNVTNIRQSTWFLSLLTNHTLYSSSVIRLSFALDILMYNRIQCGFKSITQLTRITFYLSVWNYHTWCRNISLSHSIHAYLSYDAIARQLNELTKSSCGDFSLFDVIQFKCIEYLCCSASNFHLFLHW